MFPDTFLHLPFDERHIEDDPTDRVFGSRGYKVHFNKCVRDRNWNTGQGWLLPLGIINNEPLNSEFF